MILVKLMGGLGNQMFQYAAGLRLAEKHRTTLKLDLSFYEQARVSGTPRFFELSNFDIRAAAASPAEIAAASAVGGILRGIMNRLGGVSFSLVKEEGVRFQPTVLDAPDFSYLDGYWQSEKYFYDIRELLLRDFTVRSALDGANRALVESIQTTCSVSIHVRRQDYVTDPATHQTHGVCGLEYYRSAVEALGAESPRYFVFSDDIEWARDNLSFARPAEFVGHNGPRRGYEDMRLMSLCRHNIIANSSFSWWGAWLNRNPEKTVIAPARWYLRPELDTRDVVPEGWRRL